ncbi:ISAon1 family transposase [Marinilabilia salmonicolor]|uniref:ISAon1 family transposase n=1 Tax=Marinilabilia salmonicolor TaxID=989 RepID=UPI000299F4F1|nr:transposase [Marinilabilia salmonicolor]
METYLGVNGRNFQRQYKEKLSDFYTWKQVLHADRYIVYPKNLGPCLTIDETALSNGELYTIITNKARKGKKGTIVGMFKGTQSSDIIKLILEHYPAQQRKIVREVTLDMAGNMNLIIKKCFPKATRVIDRFHVQKLAYETVQDIRIKHRWETLDAENKAYKDAKAKGIEYIPEILAKTKRICIYAKDIQRITGKSEKTGYRILDNIRKRLGKEPHQFVTIKEFADFAGFATEEVKEYIYD